MAIGDRYTNSLYLASNPSTSGDTTIIPAVPGKKIRVVSLLAVSSGVVTVVFYSGTTAISGSNPLVANSGFSIGSTNGVLLTGTGQPLIINLSTSVVVGLTITYELI